MNGKMTIAVGLLFTIGLVMGYATLFATEEDAFTILSQIGKNNVGLEKPGLETLIAKATVIANGINSDLPVSSTANAMVYWTKNKGLKIKADRSDPNSSFATLSLKTFIRMSGLTDNKHRTSMTSELNKEDFTGTVEKVTLKDGTKATQLTFTPISESRNHKREHEVEPQQILLIVTTDGLIKQYKIIKNIPGGPDMSQVIDFEYKDGLISKMTSIGTGKTTIITNTYTTVDKFTVPDKMEYRAERTYSTDKRVEQLSLIYSDVKINAKIPDEIFAEPNVPKPTETAAKLFEQADDAMREMDLEKATLKLRQIIKYYPDDPLAVPAENMLNELE